MTEDYEIIPLEEVRKLKEEIKQLKSENENSPTSQIAYSMDKLTESLEKLFEIFNVAATDIEREKLDEKSFEEKIHPLMEKLNRIEDQNKDLAEGILALADIVKKQKIIPKPLPKPIPTFNEPFPPRPFPKEGIPPPPFPE